MKVAPNDCGTYTVEIDLADGRPHLYEMSADADAPNGVCIYQGTGEIESGSLRDAEIPPRIIRQARAIQARS